MLTANPSHLDARALLGAIAYVRDDKAAHEAEVDKGAGDQPAFGEVYRVAGELSARNYRFDEAVALTRKAIDLDSTNIRAASDLGLHLMRTGDEAEARKVSSIARSRRSRSIGSRSTSSACSTSSRSSRWCRKAT